MSTPPEALSKQFIFKPWSQSEVIHNRKQSPQLHFQGCSHHSITRSFLPRLQSVKKRDHEYLNTSIHLSHILGLAYINTCREHPENFNQQPADSWAASLHADPYACRHPTMPHSQKGMSSLRMQGPDYGVNPKHEGKVATAVSNERIRSSRKQCYLIYVR